MVAQLPHFRFLGVCDLITPCPPFSPAAGRCNRAPQVFRIDIMGSSTGAGGRGESTSPKRQRNPSPPNQGKFVLLVNRLAYPRHVVADTFSLEGTSESKHDADPKADASSTANAETTKPLAPPPRPAQQQQPGNTPDYFSNPAGGSLSLEPNPFEQSFGAPDGNKLPSVAALTSPSAVLPSGATPFGWGPGSLRTGPLSPAMLSGPTNDYFSGDHIRGSFPTPNESSLRTGLTPGGSGSMFPAPSPNSALFAQIAGSSAPTPSTIDFHRTALSAAAAKREQKSQSQSQPQQSITSQPQELTNGVLPVRTETKPAPGPFDPHDNDAANGLFMLAQGRGSTQPPSQQYPVIPPPQIHAAPAQAPAVQPVNTSPHMNGNVSIAGSSARGVSEAASAGSEESEVARPNTRAKGKRTSAGANSRRKAEDNPPKPPANKRAKITNGGASSTMNGSFDFDPSDDDMGNEKEEGASKSKMTDEEKRKNFLERNRYRAFSVRHVRAVI